MSLELTCSVCGAVNGFGDEHAGQMGTCGQCQTPLYVPRREEMPPASIRRTKRAIGLKVNYTWIAAAGILVVVVGLATAAYVGLRSLGSADNEPTAQSAYNAPTTDKETDKAASASGLKLPETSKQKDKPTEDQAKKVEPKSEAVKKEEIKKEEVKKDEVKDPFAAAQLVYLNVAGSIAENGSLADAKAENVYKFTAPAAGTLVAYIDPIDGSYLQGQLVSLDGQRKQITRNESDADKRVSQILFPVEANKEYYVKVAGFDGTSGKYKATFTHVTNVPATFDKALDVRLTRTGSGSQSWYIATPGDTDTFRLVAPVTGWLYVDMKIEPGKLAGKLSAYNGNRLSPGSSLIKTGQDGARYLRVYVQAGKSYFVKAAAWPSPTGGMSTTGPYTLVFHTKKTDPDDHGNDFDTASHVFLSTFDTATATGRIDTALDIDFFRFTALQTGTMQVELNNSPGSNLAARAYAYSSIRLVTGSGAGTRLLTIPVFAGRTYYVKVMPAASIPAGMAKVGAYALSFRMQTKPPVANPQFTPVPPQPNKDTFGGLKPLPPLKPIPDFNTGPFKSVPFALPSVQGIVPDRTVVRNKLVNWLKDNDRGGPDNDFVRQITRTIDEKVYTCNNLTLLVGQDNTRSGRAYSVDSWADSVFVTELTDDQAARMGVKRTSITTISGAKKLDRKLALLPITIKDVTVDQADKLKGFDKITGRVTYEVVGTVPDKLNVRLSYMRGNSTVSNFSPPVVLNKTGTLNFSFGSVNRSDEKEFLGPLIVFVEMASMTDRTNYDFDVTICSNTIAVMLEVVGSR
jgi:hypothetical protein